MRCFSAIRYSGGIINWTQAELQKLDVITRKLFTMHGGFCMNSDVDHLYIPRNKVVEVLSLLDLLKKVNGEIYLIMYTALQGPLCTACMHRPHYFVTKYCITHAENLCFPVSGYIIKYRSNIHQILTLQSNSRATHECIKNTNLFKFPPIITINVGKM